MPIRQSLVVRPSSYDGGTPYIDAKGGGDLAPNFPPSSLTPFSTLHEPPLASIDEKKKKVLHHSKSFINMFSLHFAILILSSFLILSTLCVPQGVTEIIRPPGASPPGCIDSYLGAFSIQDVDHSGPGTETACSQPDSLRVVLDKGLLVDHLGRIGSIVANRQFQFDGPPAQAGAIYTGGWSLCPDNLIALGPQKLFYACPSGDCKLPENFK